MADAAPDEPPDPRLPLVVRAAEWLGRALGQWRRGRTARRDDAYIRAWKAAWVQGCEARWRGQTRDVVPYREGPDHDAWLAGWAWADTQPDRRDPSRPASRAHARRRATDTGNTGTKSTSADLGVR